MLPVNEKPATLSRHTSMDVLMSENPEIIAVLIKNKMHCVGCLLAPFHDVTDAAYEHDLDEDALFGELQNAKTLHSA